MPSFLSGYTKRKKITISNTNVISDLSNFPLMVKVTSDSDIGGVARSDGYDIRFTSNDGTTLLDYEREIFSITSGSATGIFWVCIPTIASAAPTDIYIYFGKADATDVSTISFWDSDYSNIYHFGEAGSGLNDSSSYGNHLTNNGIIISDGKGTLDGLSYASASFENTIGVNTSQTLSALLSVSGGTGRRSAMGFGLHNQDVQFLLGPYDSSGATDIGIEIGKAGVVSFHENGGTIVLDTQFHLGVVYKVGEADLYFNGDFVTTLEYPSDIVGISEIQHIAFSQIPTKGQFKLAQASGNFAYSDNAWTLETLITGTSVTGDYTDGFDVEFALGDGNVTQMTVESNSLAVDGSVSVITVQDGDNSSTNEVQRISMDSGNNGTYTITWDGYGATPPIAWNCSSGDFLTALETLFGNGNNSITPNGAGSFDVYFQGSLSFVNMPTPTFNVSSLNVLVDITITTPQEGIHQATDLDASGDSLIIGSELYEGSPNYFFLGNIYEARMSTIEKDGSWMKFEALNQLNDGELTFDTLESQQNNTVTLFPQKRILICA